MTKFFNSSIFLLALAAPAYANEDDAKQYCKQHDGDYYLAGEGYGNRHRHGDGYDDYRPCHPDQIRQVDRDQIKPTVGSAADRTQRGDR